MDRDREATTPKKCLQVAGWATTLFSPSSDVSDFAPTTEMPSYQHGPTLESMDEGKEDS